MPFPAILRGLQGTEGFGGAIIDPDPAKSILHNFRGISEGIERLSWGVFAEKRKNQGFEGQPGYGGEAQLEN